MVADGMGGHVAGEVASRMAVEAVEAFIEETAGADKNRTWPFPFEPTLSLEANRLKAAFRLANRPHRRGDRRLQRRSAAWPRRRRRCSPGRKTPASPTSATAGSTPSRTAALHQVTA